MKLTSHISQALDNLKIESLNPMQEASIETWKEGKDLILLSPTGSGKTLWMDKLTEAVWDLCQPIHFRP